MDRPGRSPGSLPLPALLLPTGSLQSLLLRRVPLLSSSLIGVVLFGAALPGKLPAGLPGSMARGQERAMPAPPASRPTLYNPDLGTCRPEVIRQAFRSHLQPFGDQPPAVMAQLRRLQAEMTSSSIARCLAKQLLSPAEAAQLRRELELTPDPQDGTEPNSTEQDAAGPTRSATDPRASVQNPSPDASPQRP